VRRVQALRFTAISPSGAGDAAFITTAIARLRLVGAPWLKRSSRPLTGAAGDREQTGGGYVIAGVIGTDHRDATRGLIYEPPPGIADAPDNLQAPFAPTRVQINERSLRLQAGGLAQYDRAEAFLRFRKARRASCRTRSSACGHAAAATAGARRASCSSSSRSGATRTTSICIACRRAQARCVRHGSPRCGSFFRSSSRFGRRWRGRISADRPTHSRAPASTRR
jgi:hypothetical protein